MHEHKKMTSNCDSLATELWSKVDLLWSSYKPNLYKTI